VFDQVAVIAGVAPRRSARHAPRVAALPGVNLPVDVVRVLEEAGPDADDEGTRLATGIVNGIREIPGLAGVHRMGLGQEAAVRRVVEGAGLLPRPVAAP
jgi:methylenetetrahydrofolate reductase (NADPH)